MCQIEKNSCFSFLLRKKAKKKQKVGPPRHSSCSQYNK
ncbi:hypothetical protein CUZ91_2331 [Enterococcus xinjiangensis]|nr:hypothetical protein [Enterococcus lactis]